MNRLTQLIHHRNVLVCKFSWGFVAAAMMAGLFIRRDPIALLGHPILIALAMGAVLTFFVWRKIWVIPTMYAYIGLIYLYFFLLLVGSPMLANFLFMWLGLVISAIYQNYFLIIMSGLFSLLISLYAFLIKYEAIFPGVPHSHLVYILLFNVFLTVFLLALTNFTRNLWLKAERSQTYLNNILENVDIATWSIDADTYTMEVSSGLEQITGIPAEVINQNPRSWQEFVFPEDLEVVEKGIRQAFAGLTGAAEFRVLSTNGSVRWLQGRVFPLKDEHGRVKQSAGVLIDITNRKQMEKQIEHMAYHDALTGLPNRVFFEKYFAYVLQQAQSRGIALGVLYLDVNGFKAINDNFGHSAGDQILCLIADRLREAVRDTDLVARVGGDEFVVILQDHKPPELMVIAERIMSRFESPFALSEQQVQVGLSMGISIYPDHGTDLDTLLKKADQAMYRAKKSATSITLWEDTVQ